MSSEHNPSEEEIRAIVREELENQTNNVMESVPFTRRDILRGVSILGLGAAGAGLGTYGAIGRAAAQSGTEGSGTIGTSDNPLEAIYVNELYQNTDHIDATSVSTDGLTVGSGSEVTSVWGDSGDLIPLTTRSWTIDQSTTATSWTNLDTPADRSIIDYSHYDIANITQLYASWTVYQIRQDGDAVPADFRLTLRDSGPLTTTTISTSNSQTRVVSDREAIDGTGTDYFRFEAQTDSGGEAAIVGVLNTILWGEVA